MKLIFIYGPPAVGKTTIGGMLAARTGYRFFFNHLTVPAAKAIFPDADNLHEAEGYRPLLQELRIDAIAAAADAGLDTVFTTAYWGSADDDFVADIVDIITSRGGEVLFVQLSAPQHVLVERVGNRSRSELGLGKMTSPGYLKKVLASRDMNVSVRHTPILKLDTSKVSIDDAVEQIIKYFRLP